MNVEFHRYMYIYIKYTHCVKSPALDHVRGTLLKHSLRDIEKSVYMAFRPRRNFIVDHFLDSTVTN